MRTKNSEYFKLIERFIDDYIETYDRSPSQREIATGTGMSNANVSRYLSYMREEGMLDYDGTRNFTTRRHRKSNGTVEVPVIGTVACGKPIYAEQNVEEYVRLPESWLGSGEFFMLKAKGESMIDIGIDDGDLVIVRRQNNAEQGQIIVALVGSDSATLKRYYFDDERKMIRLHPENADMKDIFVEPSELRIQGVAVKALKNIE